jgi:hypothetical protein
MTGTIAGVSATWARIATDSYFSTAEGTESASGLKLFVLPHIPAVLAGRGSAELLWMIIEDVTRSDLPFDQLARLLPEFETAEAAARKGDRRIPTKTRNRENLVHVRCTHRRYPATRRGRRR